MRRGQTKGELEDAVTLVTIVDHGATERGRDCGRDIVDVDAVSRQRAAIEADVQLV